MSNATSKTPKNYSRTFKDAQVFFQVAKTQAKKDSKVIFTDGLESYRAAYELIKELPNIMNAGIRSHMGNHRIERLHNSMWEREKVMRHLKKAKSAEKILKGYRAYYNFVRPHMALENHTPAEIATVPIQLGTNGRLDILRQAARNRQRNKKRICLSRIFFLRTFESEIKPETGNVNLTPEGQVANTVTLSAFRL